VLQRVVARAVVVAEGSDREVADAVAVEVAERGRGAAELVVHAQVVRPVALRRADLLTPQHLARVLRRERRERAGNGEKDAERRSERDARESGHELSPSVTATPDPLGGSWKVYPKRTRAEGCARFPCARRR